MLPCCCTDWTCSWNPGKTSCYHFTGPANRDVNHLGEEDVARMDVALLREQYNWTKKKQKHETRVVLFRRASEETDSGANSMVSVVPVHQERKGSVSPVCEADHRVDELERSPWRTHLEIYRRTCVGNRAIVPPHQNPVTAATTTSNPNSRSPSLTEDRSPTQEGASKRASVDSSMTDSPEELENSILPGSRKFSAPAVLSRQLSFGGHHHHHQQQPPARLSSSPVHHFPFPQRKPLTKSEAARRLGMYMSF